MSGQHEPNKIGYARVSTKGQNLDSQLDALRHAGCSRIFTDKLSGTKEQRPEWDRTLDYLRPGDTLVITELSRMTRSLRHLLNVVSDLESQGVKIISLRENIDTATATGRCFISLMGAINQMELELRAERVEAGRESAKARGKTGGRPRTNMDTISKALVLYVNTDRSVSDICETFQVPKRTFYKYLAEKRIKDESFPMRRESRQLVDKSGY